MLVLCLSWRERRRELGSIVLQFRTKIAKEAALDCTVLMGGYLQKLFPFLELLFLC